ncbi:hypothetical protein I4U23_017196 [Adineta vaga]|nr:hypothetical protein I4U23_017196 [Adineta vaga]
MKTKFENNQDIQRSSRPFLLDREFINIESHQLVWLCINTSIIPSIKDLRRIIDYTKLFSTVDKCLEYIDQTKNTTTFMIYVFDFVNDITDSKLIWTSSNSRVKETIYTNDSELINDLSYDVEQHLHLEKQNYNLAELKQTSTIYFSSSWISLIDFWCHLQYPDLSRQRLIEELKKYYADQDVQLKVLDDFNKNYKAENAIQWYTKDTFLYRSLNNALRQQNVKLLFLYGFFLQDIYQQLVKENDNFRRINSETSKLIVYRGQLISKSEIERIKNDTVAVYDLLVNKSLFSTTLKRDCALIYLNEQTRPNDDIQNVLFEIEIDLQTKSYHPFTDISHLSQFPIESEVLFMIGTSFKVNTKEITYKLDENLWIMKLTLEGSFKDYETHLKIANDKRTLKNCINLLPKTTLNDMIDISIDELNIIFEELLLMYPFDNQWISAIQYRTFAIYHQIHSNDYDLALINYIDDEELDCLRNIAKIYSDMAVCYDFYMKDLIMSNKYYDLAIHFYHSALERSTSTIYEKIKIYKQLAYLYDCKMNVNNDNINYYYGLKSIEYYELCIKNISDTFETEDYSMYKILREIARLYIIHHEFDKGVSIYEKLVRLYQQLTNGIRQYTGAYEIENIYRYLITLYTHYQPNYELAIHYQCTLHDYVMKLPIRTHIYDRDLGKYVIGVDEHYEIARKKEILAIHNKRLAKINLAFNKNDLARTQLQDAFNLYNEIREFSWVYLDIQTIQEKVLALDMIVKLDI